MHIAISISMKTFIYWSTDQLNSSMVEVNALVIQKIVQDVMTWFKFLYSDQGGWWTRSTEFITREIYLSHEKWNRLL